ncbi:Ubiquitin-protein ligase E3A (E6AP ubiquitin-protein ligase) (HECT-type ubiquitin transferase E3A) (Human papillomavirus E6-associated protein) (Oncogenic protein-associated protein E6-AP) (Renal carcinoma antigen NY-REN-54) [Durusdinium trenchii]|uniref:HECT-type E3 ubiquitin transferase n=1 Tax=Durusdinium trenchii TaxID=1381693 RepID=A0ABP0J4X9_9DINO
MVVGLSSCHDHTVAMVISMPKIIEETKMIQGRPQTSASTRDGRRWNGDAAAHQPLDAAAAARANRAAMFIKTMNTIHEELPPAQPPDASPDLSMPPRPSTGQRHSEVLTSGCTSRVGRSPRGRISVALPRLRRTGASGGDEGLLEEVVLLQPVVQPGVAASVGFASLSVAKLLDLIQAAQGGPGAMEDLRSSLSAAFSSPSLLNASFCFPGLYKPRLDAGGLLKVFKGLIGSEELFAQVEMHMVNAAFEGLSLWANDHDEAASLIHRDQLRGLAALLLSPVLVDPGKPQPYEVMCRIMRLVAWMPAEGRRELQELLIDDCSEEEVLRSLVSRVRLHCDETVLRAHQMQRLSPEIWEGLMLLQLLWGTNEAIAQRLAKSLRSSEWPEADFGQSLAQTLSQLGKPAASVLGRFTLAPQVRPPVPSSEFHLQSLAEEKVPPELEFRLFVENACAGPITPSEVLELPLYAARTDYGFEYVLPSKMRSFMANRNLVPVSYTRKVLQVENHHAQVYLQHQVARRVAADLEVLPGHEIHIDPALLFFILKVHRDRILEDTTAALQKATPEDLRRQLKVVFEGEQGVDEGGLAREFFRLLSAHVFTVEGGLFDPLVAQNARVLWFNSASVRESTEFWLAGVILGLVVYNNMPGLDVRFPPVVFKKIKNEPLVLEDLRQVHPDTYLSLRSLLSWEPEEELDEEERNAIFENTFCLDFVVTYEMNGATETRELCEGGKDRVVSYKNREEFVRLYCEWLLTQSVERQFEPFRKGVRRVCDSPLFNALHSAELELIVCGEQALDFAQLRKNAHYDGYQATDECSMERSGRVWSMA